MITEGGRHAVRGGWECPDARRLDRTWRQECVADAQPAPPSAAGQGSGHGIPGV